MTNNVTTHSDFPSSFFLRFANEERASPTGIILPSTLVEFKGYNKRVSFPRNNTQNYTNNATHMMLISSGSKHDFNVAVTFVDIEPFRSSIRSVGDLLRLYEIVDGSLYTTVKLYKRCMISFT